MTEDTLRMRMLMGEKPPADEVMACITHLIAQGRNEEGTSLLQMWQSGERNYQAVVEEKITADMIIPIAATISDFPQTASLTLDVNRDGTFKVKVKGIRGASTKNTKQSNVPVSERTPIAKGDNDHWGTIPLYKNDININGKSVYDVVMTAKANNYAKDDVKMRTFMYGGKEGKYSLQYGQAYRRMQSLNHPQAVAIKGDITHPEGEVNALGYRTLEMR